MKRKKDFHDYGAYAAVWQLQEALRATRDNTNSLGLNPCSSEQRDHIKYNNILCLYSSSLLDMYIYGNGKFITDLKLTETA